MRRDEKFLIRLILLIMYRTCLLFFYRVTDTIYKNNNYHENMEHYSYFALSVITIASFKAKSTQRHLIYFDFQNKTVNQQSLTLMRFLNSINDSLLFQNLKIKAYQIISLMYNVNSAFSYISLQFSKLFWYIFASI